MSEMTEDSQDHDNVLFEKIGDFCPVLAELETLKVDKATVEALPDGTLYLTREGNCY